MIEISVNEVQKNYGYKNLFNKISFNIMTSDRVGIVGKNGSGKSTILKLIAQIEHADAGTISIRNESRIGYIQQTPDQIAKDTTTKDFLFEAFADISILEEQMHCLENEMAIVSEENALTHCLEEYQRVQTQFESLGGYDIQEKMARIITEFKIEHILNTPFYLLSGGEKTVVCLAKTMLNNPSILLLDEPTNHMDIRTLRWFENYVKNYSGTVVVISHDRFFLDKVTTKTLMLCDGKCELFYGNYSFAIKERERQVTLEFEAYKNQQKKLKR